MDEGRFPFTGSFHFISAVALLYVSGTGTGDIYIHKTSSQALTLYGV